MHSVPLPDTGLPGLEPLINGPLWQEWSERGRVFPLARMRGAVRYLRLKPDVSCRLAVFGEVAGDGVDPPDGFLIHLYGDRERARTAFEKVRAKEHYRTRQGFEPFLSDSHALVALPFPNDLEIPALRRLYRPGRLDRVVSKFAAGGRSRPQRTTMKLLAYKPGRRAVFRVGATFDNGSPPLSMHVKVENPVSFGQSFSRLEAVAARVSAGVRWRVPTPRGVVHKRCLAAVEWVDGLPFEVAICESALYRVGRALAELHETPVELPAGTSWAGQAKELVAQTEDLGRLFPAAAERIHRIGRRLHKRVASIPESIPRTIHGDFHLGQVLLADGRPVFVDFDRAVRGSPLEDLGSFIAHLADLALDRSAREAFLAGYRSRRAAGPAATDLATAVAAALFRRAVLPFRRLEPDWPAQMRAKLGRVDDLLRGSEW